MTVFTADLAHVNASDDITSAKSRVIVNGVHTPLPISDKASPLDSATLLRRFVNSSRTLKQIRQGQPVNIDGRSLSIADVAAVARYNAPVALSSDVGVRESIASSRRVIEDKVREAKSVYGVSTGFGGSADTRTADTLALGNALLQHQHAGVISVPDEESASRPLPLLDPLSSTSMPESWVRGAMLVRLNSLARGHSGVRWELLERMVSLLLNQVTPLVPMRGSISASGDLSPLSYIAGTIVGNPSIRAWSGPAGKRTIVRSPEALQAAGLSPLPLHSKEHLGILNGTAFSASVAGLALHDATHLAILAQICTAMGVEALVGTQYSFDPFIHAIARPHPGQVESATVIHDLLNESQLAQVHEEELTIENDRGLLRQDRYALRTAPQFIGPALEDILSALDTVTQECNSTTDNPLIDGETGQVHHGGNFQAMAVSSAMEKTRLALYHAGKLLFAQCTELLNPAMNRGLPPSLAATDPSHNYHGKGLDIATAAYVSELGYLANPVSTHIQSAEMHNQAVNSLALISARKTIDSVQTLAMLSATYLYLLCQAIDLRVLQDEFLKGFDHIIAEELNTTLSHVIPAATLAKVLPPAQVAAHTSFALTATMDANERLVEMMGAVSRSLLESLAQQDESLAIPLAPLRNFRSGAATRGAVYLQALRRAFLTGERGAAPAAPYLKGTRPMYEFVRVTLGISMHGRENLDDFEKGLGVEDVTIGQNVSKIYETILDERMKDVIVGMYD